jgi:hypothetical protein
VRFKVGKESAALGWNGGEWKRGCVTVRRVQGAQVREEFSGCSDGNNLRDEEGEHPQSLGQARRTEASLQRLYRENLSSHRRRE